MVKVKDDANTLPYLRAADLPKSGTKVVIVGEGEYRKNEFDRTQLVLPVKKGTAAYSWPLTPGAVSRLQAAWGDDTKKWVGKTVRVKPFKLTKGKLAGKMVIEAEPAGK